MPVMLPAPFWAPEIPDRTIQAPLVNGTYSAGMVLVFNWMLGMAQGVQGHGEESRPQAWRLREDVQPGRGGITLKCDKDSVEETGWVGGMLQVEELVPWRH